jgi:hypothetical protein
MGFWMFAAENVPSRVPDSPKKANDTAGLLLTASVAIRSAT